MFGSILFQSSFSHEDCIIYHLTIRLLAFFFISKEALILKMIPSKSSTYQVQILRKRIRTTDVTSLLNLVPASRARPHNLKSVIKFFYLVKNYQNLNFVGNLKTDLQKKKFCRDGRVLLIVNDKESLSRKINP